MIKYTDIKNINLTEIKGIGPERSKLLKKKGINNALDILCDYPREYENRTEQKKIIELQEGEKLVVKGLLVSHVNERRIRGNLTITSALIKDETGSLKVVWYNQAFVKRKLRFGEEYYFYGKAIRNNNIIEMHNPIFEPVKEGKGAEIKGIFPIYSLISGLSQNIMRKIVAATLDKVGYIKDYLPDWVKEEFDLCDIDYAILGVHFPEDERMLNRARRRLVFDEFLILQLTLNRFKSLYIEDSKGILYNKTPEVYNFIKKLPFTLTDAQLRVFKEIEKDMESPKIMNRLVQGDVGSGKTIVALLSMLKAVCNGYQAAYMVPTEILSLQHFSNIGTLLKNGDFKIVKDGEERDVKVVLLKGKQTKKEREEVLSLISSGEADIIIGTHALIQENVKFNNLGLVVTDEQHRFGVRQRATLKEKGENIYPDVLVMTATPIPRTLALIIYGDLDISIIDELPKGRIPIKTYVVNESMRERINNFIIKTVKSGRQVYIVCPAVEEGEVLDIKSAKELYEEVSKGVFSELSVGLIYGKMKNSEKDQVMSDFATGKIDVLIATTVIEVGVDVPNATLMVIENAERFGLAQLHQMRGRVGRGNLQSYCILFNQSNSEIAIERMKVLASTNDGFVISEKDLKLRGPGEFLGTRQHGIPTLRIANLYEDINIMKEAQKACGIILDKDYMLSKHEFKELNELTKNAEELMNL